LVIIRVPNFNGGLRMKKQQKFEDHALHALHDNFKHELARELGLMPRIHNNAWNTITINEINAVGGRMSYRVKSKAENKLI